MRHDAPHADTAARPRLLTQAEVATRLKLSIRTLQRMRAAKQGPAYCVLGTKAVRYLPDAIERYISETTST